MTRDRPTTPGFPPIGTLTEDEYVRADKWFREYDRASERASEARRRLVPGSSRARVTTANARWARAAEARDGRARALRDHYRSQIGASHVA